MRLKKTKWDCDDGFLVKGTFLLFYCLERCSLFYWIRVLGEWWHRKIHPHSLEKPFVKTYVFPEIWVIGNIATAIIFERVARMSSSKLLLIVMVIYAMERVMEMFVYQVNVLLFHRMIPEYMEKTEKEKERDIKANIIASNRDSGYAIKSSTRTVLMLILNMVEYVLQFAVIFVALKTLFGIDGSYIGILDSFGLFMNITAPEEFAGNPLLAFAYAETIIGMFMNIICLARFVGMLPEVAEKGNNR